jgi:ABC-type proline/glycine betaine transport system permease subunit
MTDTILHNRSAEQDAQSARRYDGHDMKQHCQRPATLLVAHCTTVCTSAIAALGLGLIQTYTVYRLEKILEPVLTLIQLLLTTRTYAVLY